MVLHLMAAQHASPTAMIQSSQDHHSSPSTIYCCPVDCWMYRLVCRNGCCLCRSYIFCCWGFAGFFVVLVEIVGNDSCNGVVDIIVEVRIIIEVLIIVEIRRWSCIRWHRDAAEGLVTLKDGWAALRKRTAMPHAHEVHQWPSFHQWRSCHLHLNGLSLFLLHPIVMHQQPRQLRQQHRQHQQGEEAMEGGAVGQTGDCWYQGGLIVKPFYHNARNYEGSPSDSEEFRGIFNSYP